LTRPRHLYIFETTGTGTRWHAGAHLEDTQLQFVLKKRSTKRSNNLRSDELQQVVRLYDRTWGLVLFYDVILQRTSIDSKGYCAALLATNIDGLIEPAKEK